MKFPLIAVLLLLLAGCEESSQSSMNVREYLVEQGVSDRVIERLIMQAELSADDIEGLRQFDHVYVLQLVAANPGASRTVLAELAQHDHAEVRTGVAMNPDAPPELLLKLRVPGRYTLLNGALARHPHLPPEVLREMYDNGEALVSSIAMNPNTPPDVLRAIAREGEELDRIWLAGNPSLPEDVARELEQNPSKILRARLANQRLQDPDDEVLAR